ncbi:uncharacterized protein LOC135495180 [Lineus longissimus]|uniref:uncharacterized protein LOC135495180 n=1 Tax=Lineus longissimus TaxID=88925 RepID=UPI002B4DA26E
MAKLVIFLGLAFVGYALGRAVDERIGPMNAMDNLHGVLMHGDAKVGEDHRGEDKMKALQEMDEMLNDKKHIGPQDRMTELHDTLMHPDGKGTSHDLSQDGPELKKDFGVPDAMDHLHGVLMHGDGAQGRDHALEDAKHIEDDAKSRGSMELGNLMEDVHGILMHGDKTRGKDHKHEDEKETESDIPDGPIGVDPDSALHSGEHKHNEEAKEKPDEFDPNRLWEEKRKKPLAFSFGRFISSDIMDNVDKLKKRYLSRFFGSAEKKDNLEVKKDDDTAKMDKDRPVSPRMKAAYDIGPKKEDNPFGSGVNGNPPKHDET